MSLLRLLTTGKSLVGLKKPENRYHLPGEMGLPKFGGKKNPFRATVFPDKTEGAEPAASMAAPEVGAVESTTLVDPTPEPQPAAASASVHSAAKAEQAAPAQARERVAGRTSPFKALLLWGRAKKANPARALAGRPLVQGELSLDRVKVVRNDLSETDFEIVPLGRVERPATVRSEAAARAVPARDGECVVASVKM
jgi:hypothetical protein